MSGVIERGEGPLTLDEAMVRGAATPPVFGKPAKPGRSLSHTHFSALASD
jgi:hypothetical protein